MSILEINDLTHGFGDRILYRNASLSLNRGEKVGLIGANGAGKSTLFSILNGLLIPDGGDFSIGPRLRAAYLDQYAELDRFMTVEAYLRTAFSRLYGDARFVEEASASLTERYDEKLLSRMLDAQARLEKGDFYSLDSVIQRVSNGLGIADLGYSTLLGELSGGQRAKVIFAKLLLEKPDLLFLDEPTNFLDRSHISWLARTLADYEGAVFVISHDTAFLDRFTTHICEIENYTFYKYTGNYSAYLAQKGQKKEEYLRAYAKQQVEIEKLEDYIAKNRSRASTAAMARGRQKKLDRMIRLEAPLHAAKPSFFFPYTEIAAHKLLTVDRLEIGYYPGHPLLSPVSLTLTNGERVAVTGFNGIGKTTLFKTLTGLLPPLSGSFAFHKEIRFAYFEQDFIWPDDGLTPLEQLSITFPGLQPRDARKVLSRSGIRADLMNRPLSTLSGGEQAKVKLACLSMTPSNLLLLDEPTNHLDGDAKDALRAALLAYPGSLLVVSHDAAFTAGVCGRVYDVERLLRR